MYSAFILLLICFLFIFVKQNTFDLYHSVGIQKETNFLPLKKNDQVYQHVHSHLDASGSSAWNTNFMTLLIHLRLHVSTAVNMAPIMTSFGSCRGPGAAKWDYTAGYSEGFSEEAQPVKGGHATGMLIDWFDALRGSPASNSQIDNVSFVSVKETSLEFQACGRRVWTWIRELMLHLLWTIRPATLPFGQISRRPGLWWTNHNRRSRLSEESSHSICCSDCVQSHKTQI